MPYIQKLEIDGREFVVQVDRPNVQIPDNGEVRWLPIKLNMDDLWEGVRDVKMSLYDHESRLETWTLEQAEMKDGQITYKGVNYELVVRPPDM